MQTIDVVTLIINIVNLAGILALLRMQYQTRALLRRAAAPMPELPEFDDVDDEAAEKLAAWRKDANTPAPIEDKVEN